MNFVFKFSVISHGRRRSVLPINLYPRFCFDSTVYPSERIFLICFQTATRLILRTSLKSCPDKNSDLCDFSNVKTLSRPTLSNEVYTLLQTLKIIKSD